MNAYPRGRDLDRRELRNLTADLVAFPESWRHLVSHDPGHRVYTQLWRDSHIAVWLICWMEGQDTGFHDHDLSSGAVAVAAGEIKEERLVLGGEPRVRTFSAGEAFDFGACDIHRVLHTGSAKTVTLHAYSPPLWRMGAYSVLEDGVLARHSVSYAEELRPLGLGA